MREPTIKWLAPMLGLLLSGGLLHADALAQMTILADDFEDGDHDGWSVLYAGSWRMGGGCQSSYAVTSDSYNQNDLYHPAAASSFVLDYDLRLAGPSFGDGDLYFQVQNPTPEIELWEHYAVELHRPGDSLDRILVRFDQEATVLAETAPIIFDSGWHHIRIQRTTSGWIRVYVDGMPHMEAWDQTLTAPGDILLRAWWNEVSYDNFLMVDVPVPVEDGTWGRLKATFLP